MENKDTIGDSATDSARTISLEFHLTAEDYQEAVKLQTRQSIPRKLFVMTAVTLSLAITIFGLNVAQGNAPKLPNFEFQDYHFLIVAVIGVFCFSFWKTKRDFAKAVEGKPIHYKFEDKFLHWSQPEGEGKLKMSAFTRWLQGETLYLLFQTDRIMYMIPKRVVASEDKEVFEEFLTDKIGPAG